MDTPILLVHISSQIATQTIRDAQTRLLPIYGETCPQYLWLLSENLKGENFEGTFIRDLPSVAFTDIESGAKAVCSPPLRDSVEDTDSIWKGIANGTFTTFSSDHAPTKYAQFVRYTRVNRSPTLRIKKVLRRGRQEIRHRRWKGPLYQDTQRPAGSRNPLAAPIQRR